MVFMRALASSRIGSCRTAVSLRPTAWMSWYARPARVTLVGTWAATVSRSGLSGPLVPSETGCRCRRRTARLRPSAAAQVTVRRRDKPAWTATAACLEAPPDPGHFCLLLAPGAQRLGLVDVGV